ncbi:MAG: hypothetical protein JF887_10925 [Candidatus Dormibacteraeota bacterium]|uniref:Uncharacterized protein n=1 Tax=Candidatus Amunia macphersoniae TaxID=3127014 RepID=A0A934NJR8_9BACT|nr:hypothetical protein [Candidatus Dormibacteraeota bacterium]
MPDVKRLTRGASPILLLLAALCFLLPFVGVSCNTAAAGAAIGSVGSIGGSSGSNNAGASAACLQALNGRDLFAYSGVNLITGSNPSVDTNIPGCPSSSSPSSGAADSQPPPQGIGVQPLLVIALVLIAVGIVATVLRAPLRAIVAGAAALLALVMVLANNSAVHGTIVAKLNASGGGALSSTGFSGALDSFINIHPAIGFTLILLALVMAIVVNGAALLLGSGLRLTGAVAGAAPTSPGMAPPAPPPGPPPARPPS